MKWIGRSCGSAFLLLLVMGTCPPPASALVMIFDMIVLAIFGAATVIAFEKT